MVNYQIHLMQENNGQIVFMKLEHNYIVDHAGHLQDQKFYLTEFALQAMDKLIKFYLHNI